MASSCLLSRRLPSVKFVRLTLLQLKVMGHPKAKEGNVRPDPLPSQGHLDNHGDTGKRSVYVASIL